MPTIIGAYEAKTHLPSLLDRVERGEQIVITKHGKPVAKLVPISGKDQDRKADAIKRLLEFAQGHTLGIPIKELINEGRP